MVADERGWKNSIMDLLLHMCFNGTSIKLEYAKNVFLIGGNHVFAISL